MRSSIWFREMPLAGTVPLFVTVRDTSSSVPLRARSAVTPRIEDKIACLDDAGVGWYFGGTFFEKHVAQSRFEDYRELCRTTGCTTRGPRRWLPRR